MNFKDLLNQQLNAPPGAKPESEMRKNVLFIAKHLGCVPEVQEIFQKYDKLLAQTTDPLEKVQIGHAGVKELHLLLGCRGALIVNGQIMLPPTNSGNSGIIL